MGILLAILLFSALFRGLLIDLPFHRNGEGMGSFYAIFGRNYLEHGIFRTALVPILGVGESPVASDGFTLYPNHPPFVPLLVAGSYAVFGDGEWQTRLPTVLFTLGSIALLYVLLLHRRGVRLAVLGAGLFACVPITLRFGGQPDVINSQLVFFILLTVATYLRLHEFPSIARLIALCISFALTVFTDWPGFYVVPVLCAYWAFTRNWRTWGWITAFGLFSIACFAALYAHVAIVTGDWSLILNQVLRRSSESHTDAGTRFDWLMWWNKAILGHNVIDHTWPVLALWGLWMISLIAWPRGRDSATKLGRLLLAIGLIHVFIGRQGVLVHDWWWWPITPAICVGAALFIDDLLNWMGRLSAQSMKFTSIMTMLLLIAFAGWNLRVMWQWFHDPFIIFGGQTHYTIVELGEAIRAAAPPDHAVALVDHDDEPSLWYYGWRPITMGVWSAEDLDALKTQTEVDLVFRYKQKWSAPPAGLVFPINYSDRLGEFRRHLESRYRQIEPPPGLEGKFLIFDLRSKAME